MTMENEKKESSESKLHDESEIKKFFAGKTILLTGSTGFMGKVIVEKILRSCPEIRKLYLLIRPKKELRFDERLKKYFQDPVFEKALGLNSNVTDRVEAIQGDLMMADIGLSPQDRHTLITETDIIIHNAAVTTFFAKVSMLLKVNVLAVKALLDLGNDCKRLETFLYVSTAFSQSYMQTLHEKIYPMPVDLKMIQDMIKADTDNPNGLNNEAVKSLIGHWPNIYTFTKAFAETVVDEYSKRSSFACCIFRPSIVMATWKEPVEGWIGSKGGFAFSLIAMSLGVLKVVRIACEDSIADAVPADLSINNMLASVWYIAVHRKNAKGATMVFNCGTSVCHPTNLTARLRNGLDCVRKNPSKTAIWYTTLTITRHELVVKATIMLLNVIPAMIVDALFLLCGRKPFVSSMVRGYIEVMLSVMYFANGDFRIHTSNLEKMWNSLNVADRKLFECDLRNIDWESYTEINWKGVKRHLLKEPAETTEQIKRRFFRLKVLHYCTVSIILLSLTYFFYRILSSMFSFF